MNIKDFKNERIDGREDLLKNILKVFKAYKPVAIHQFGSGSTGYKDEFSDIDLWITFKDSDIKNIVKRRNAIFKDIAPVISNHYSKSWSPVNGSSNSIIHETNNGLFIVDYYISPLSNSVIKENSAVLYGDDSIQRGEWILNNQNKKIHDTHTLQKDINLIINLCFISIKLIVRNVDSKDFLETLKLVMKKIRERYNLKLRRRILKLNYKTNYRLLTDLSSLANKNQRKSINKIKKYIKTVETLYS